MTCRVSDVIHAIEKLAPPALAASWDNAGLQVGDRDWPVHLIWVALDPLPDVVSKACEAKVDMLVTHHPLIFRTLKQVDVATPQGAIIAAAIRHRLAIYAVHTNLDAAEGGLNDALAEKIGLQDIDVLNFSGISEMQNLVRTGLLPKETTLVGFAEAVKRLLGLDSLRIAGRRNMRIRRVVVCCGSGSSLLPAFFASDGDAFLSGDLKYHDARAIELAGKGLVDIGHFASEHIMVETLSKQLGQLLRERALGATVEPYLFEADPFEVF